MSITPKHLIHPIFALDTSLTLSSGFPFKLTEEREREGGEREEGKYEKRRDEVKKIDNKPLSTSYHI